MDNIIINIDSRFRNKDVYPNSGKFIYNLSENIKNCKYIRLSSFEFPNVFFTFTKKKINTSFTITVGTSSYEVLLDDGFYNLKGFMLALNNRLIDANTILGSNFKAEINLNNGYITIQDDTGPFSIDFSNSPSRYPSLGYQLGYRLNNYSVTTTTVIDGLDVYALISETQLDIICDSYLFLKINDYGVIYHDFEDILIKDDLGNIIERQKYIGDRNIFAKIIMNANKADYIFDGGNNFLTKSFIFRQPTDLNRLSIELTDLKGTVIDMNSMDYSFTLELGIIYDLSLKYELTDSIDNKFLVNGLLNSPNLEKINKKSHNLNITNDLAHYNNDLTEYRIINKDNFKEDTLTYDLETLNAIFDTIEEDGDTDNIKEQHGKVKNKLLKNKDEDNDEDNDKETKKEKKKEKKKKKKYNFSY